MVVHCCLIVVMLMMLKGMPSFALIACLMMNHNDDARMNFASMLCPSARCHHHGHLDLSFCFIFSLTQSVPFTLNNYKHLTVSLKIKIKKKLSNTHFNTHLLQTTKTKAKKKHTHFCRLKHLQNMVKFDNDRRKHCYNVVNCEKLESSAAKWRIHVVEWMELTYIFFCFHSVSFICKK